MINRWTILIVLFLARTAMAFQFQAAAALGPALGEAYGVSLLEIGALIGLYLAPGLFVALPGGVIARQFGEKRVVAAAMALMLFGALMALFGPGWSWVLAGRIIAGVGGVVLNIVMTKMLADWFVGREISTAMALFINSWPIGIALALYVLPGLAEAQGLAAARWLVVVAVGATLLLFLAGFRPAPGAVAPPPLRLAALARLPFLPLLMAGLVWGLYNVALAMVFSFAPTVLLLRGLEVAAAGGLVSLFMVVFSVSVPVGGMLADRSGRPGLIVALSLVAFVLAPPLVGVLALSWLPALFVALAILGALGAGPIMAMPARVLPPEARSVGMGLFFTVYYATMMLAPILAGALAEAMDDVRMTLVFGGAMALVALGAQGGFAGWTARRPAAA